MFEAVGLGRGNGLSADAIYYLAPDLVQEREESSVAGKPTAPPNDPLYPSDTRSVCGAYTPIYRGGQNGLLVVNDNYTNHGPYTESISYAPGGVFPSWDGTTTKSLWIPTSYTEEEKTAYRQSVYDFLFPSDGFTIIGLEQLYASNTPFADETEPTVKEIEDWKHDIFAIMFH